MKTRNNLFKAAAIFAFVLFAGNVFAIDKDAVVSSHENITESTLEIEHWMTSNIVWDVENVPMIVEETEAGLGLENWMTNEETWKTGYFEVVENETEMDVEQWMVNYNCWKI